MLTALKQDVNYAFLKEVDSIALQQALRNLDAGYTNFFEHRAAHPKFKSKKSAKQSYRTLNIDNGIRISNKRIQVDVIFAQLPNCVIQIFELFLGRDSFDIIPHRGGRTFVCCQSP